MRQDSPAVADTFNILEAGGLDALRSCAPTRFESKPAGGEHLDLRGAPLRPLAEIDEAKIASLARIVRGLVFAAVDGAKSGHPGGSSSKAEMVLTLIASGALGFDAFHPKHAGRDRVVWSAGHCSPLFHSTVALIYEALRRRGFALPPEDRAAAMYPEELARFRRFGGPSGHVESFEALADTSTGSSGHGISAGLGFAVLHRSCGLATRAFVIAGDAETEEGMTYEARNVASTLGVRNMIVLLDYNGFGIDGPITDAMPYPYLDHWLGLGWNAIEANGHDVRELAYACRLAAAGFGAEKPTVIVCHCIKGLHYGKLENTSDSHGTPLPHAEYVEAMRKLGFAIPGKEGDVAADIGVVTSAIADADVDYLVDRLQASAAMLKPEKELVARMATALPGRPMADYRSFERPAELPPELVFQEGS